MTRIKIFVIEDNPGDLVLIREMIKDSGLEFELENSETLKEGLETFKKLDYDILLLDLGLPDSDGIETFLKAHSELTNKPIIILTGFSDEEQATNAVSRGAQDYLIKGQVDPNLLSKSIRYALERKKSELKILKEEEKSRTYFDSAGVMRAVVGIDKKIKEINSKGCEILGYSKEELMGKNWFEYLSPKNREKNEKIFEEMIAGTISPYSQKEQTILRKNGEKRIISWSITLLKDDSGRVSSIINSGEDITKSKQYEKDIKSSLEEKELLLREIHHRVKNNLQIISSLLNLQANHIKDEDILDHFNDYQNRIKSISLVHEKLYRSSDIGQVEMSNYTQHLVEDLVRNYGRPDLDILFDIEEVKLGIDTAIPCGLIINELVSNSLKHAFPDNKTGEIRIKFNKNASNEFELLIQDNGVGISPKIDLEHSETLGLELVSSLVQQLDGCMQMQKNPGTTFYIKFQEIKYSKRI